MTYRTTALLDGFILLAGRPAGAVDNDPAARFRGALTYDFGVTNVRWEAATPEYSYVVFDLSWSFSWRAKWTEPAATSATGKDMSVGRNSDSAHRPWCDRRRFRIRAHEHRHKKCLRDLASVGNHLRFIMLHQG